MGDLTLMCPLCCNLTFNSKESLLEHIAAIISNVFCPVCHEKVLSLELLSAHLANDNCSPIGPAQNIVFINAENDDYESENSTALEDNTHPGLSSENISQAGVEDATDINNIQIDLMKCLQNQELKLVKEDGINRYIIVSDENGALKQEEIVTKQNNDGTVSFTSKDIKSEAHDIVLEVEEQKEDEEGSLIQEYSCSTCQMSFTSVFEHITNYHTDQDVVVEGNIGNMSELPNMEMMDTEEPVKETTSRRVITDMGNIVETPLLSKNSTEKIEAPPRTAQTKSLRDASNEKNGRKKYVHVENLCESVIRDLKPSDQKQVQCHKVVIAPAVSKSGATVKMYTCTVCKVFGSQLGDFRTKPCKPVKYPCNQCELSYDNSKSLCAHMKVHKTRPGSEGSLPLAKPDPETYECEICGTYFLTNKSLKLHKRMHDPIKSKPIEAPKNCASGEDRYQCNVCGKMIPVGYRAVHKASHEHDKMLNCGICNKKFSSAEYLEMHMNVHNMDKPQQTRSDKSLPYSCVYCERRFARPHEKVKHERIHTGEKPHECEICGKSFRVSYCLTLHMRTHTGARPYACPHCDKRFKAHSVYNHHLLTHSEVRAYKCPFCPKAFKTSVQLAGHKNSHTKPFSCTQCNRPFASLYAVRVHTETHNRLNNLKFKCALCGASYARSFALKDHVKQVHKQELHAVDPLQVDQEDWINKNGVESDKDLTEEITDLEIPADELIVPN